MEYLISNRGWKEKGMTQPPLFTNNILEFVSLNTAEACTLSWFVRRELFLYICNHNTSVFLFARENI